MHRASRAAGATLLLAAGTAACTLLPWYRVPDDAFARGTVTVACCLHGEETVEITYLGVGGWLFRVGGSTVLTAPLYSNPGLVETGLTPITADPAAIDRELPREADAATAILVGHGHYDHLMDVPWIMAHRATDAVLYANRTSWLQVEPYGFGQRALEEAGGSGPPGPSGGELRPAPGGGRVVVVDDGLAGDDREEGRWIRVAPRARVMALRSDHAPHLAGVTLYSGERRVSMDAAPASAEEWLDGSTYAWLIDLLAEDGSRLMRIYYQDAVAAPPYGLVPPSVDGSVDVAVVVPATYAEVDWHPEAILDDAGPRHVLLGHWESFFRPADEPAEPVPFTLLEDFRKRLERALPPGAGWHLPVPGTRFVFR